MKKILIFAFLGGLLLNGCSEKQSTVQLQPEKIGSPNIDYTEGYRDGCSAGYNVYVRNQKLYDFNADYRYGWNKGFEVCIKKATENN